MALKQLRSWLGEEKAFKSCEFLVRLAKLEKLVQWHQWPFSQNLGSFWDSRLFSDSTPPILLPALTATPAQQRHESKGRNLPQEGAHASGTNRKTQNDKHIRTQISPQKKFKNLNVYLYTVYCKYQIYPRLPSRTWCLVSRHQSIAFQRVISPFPILNWFHCTSRKVTSCPTGCHHGLWSLRLSPLCGCRFHAKKSTHRKCLSTIVYTAACIFNETHTNNPQHSSEPFMSFGLPGIYPQLT